MPNWDREGTPDYEHWRQQLNMRKGLQYDPTKPMYGYAKVVQVQGPGITAYNPALENRTAGQVENAVVAAAGSPGTVQSSFAPTAPVAPAVPVETPAQTAPVFAAPSGV